MSPFIKSVVNYRGYTGFLMRAIIPTSISGGDRQKDQTRVNAWIEASTATLTVGNKVTLGFEVNVPVEQKSTEVPLIVSLNGPGAIVLPSWQKVTLTKTHGMKPFRFEVEAGRAGEITLRLNFFLEREMALLEEYELRMIALEASGNR